MEVKEANRRRRFDEAGSMAIPDHGPERPSQAKRSSKASRDVLRRGIVSVFALMVLFGPMAAPAFAHGTGWPVHGPGGVSCFPTAKELAIVLPVNVRSWTGAQELVTLRNYLYWLDTKTNKWVYWFARPEYRGYANSSGMMEIDPITHLKWWESTTGALRNAHSFRQLVPGYKYMVIQRLTWTSVGQVHDQAASVYNNLAATSCQM